MEEKEEEMMKPNRLKLFLAAGLLLLASVFLLVLKLNQAGSGLHQFTYVSYVSSEYVPNYKKEFGTWPSNLDELPEALESKIKQSQADYVRDRLKLILKFHKDKYKGLVASRKDEKNFHYSLLIEGGNVKCESDLQSGYCE